jgi:basic membrane protein A
LIKFAAVAASAAMVLAACGGDEEEPSTGTGATSAAPMQSDAKVGVAYDIGGRGDQSFNDSAAAGLDKLKSEFGLEVKELEAGQSETDAQKEERLRLLADGGYSPVIAIGFAYAKALGKVAPDYPDIRFAIVDDASITAGNVTSLVFAEEQGSYLTGVIAGQATKTGTVGFIGGVNVPLIHKFEAGFTEGVKSVKPDAKVEVAYLTEPPDFGGFNDPAKGKTTAQGMLDGGADVIYAAAGGSGSGVFEAVAAKDGAWAIGVDSDQYLTAADAVKPRVLTSMLKRVDNAVYLFGKSVVEDTPLTGVQTFDLATDGVGYSASNSEVEAFSAKADEAKQKIVDGAVTVPTEPAK